MAGGELSSFIVAGRDALPAEPSGWLSSPLAALNLGLEARWEERDGLSGLSGLSSLSGRLVASHTIDKMDQTDAQGLLSLRQIAPLGFLTQAFAVDQGGCAS